MKLREKFKKETGFTAIAYRQDYGGQKPYEDGFADEYVEWLESKVENLSLCGVINWVDIKDKKPDFGGFFLCCLENGHVTEIMYEFFNDVWHRNNQEVKQHNKLVYWAELPKPPCL